MSNAIEAAGIYDSLSADRQDMSRESFIKEYCRLTDPVQFKKDATDIMNKRRAARGIKAKIERAIENGR